MREHQATTAEDTVAAREARVQQEVDQKVAEVHAALVDEYRLKSEFLEAELKGRTTALRSRLDEAEQREKAAAAALISVQAELASARA